MTDRQMRLMGVRITGGRRKKEKPHIAPIPLTTQFQFPHARINSTRSADEGKRLVASD